VALTVDHGVGLVTGAAVAYAAWHLLQLAGDGWAFLRFRRDVPTRPAPALQDFVDRCARRLGVRRSVQVRATDADVVPLTWGTWRPTLVLPSHMLPASKPSSSPAGGRDASEVSKALRLAVTHELVHIRRFDVLADLLERAVAAAFAFHPAVPRLRRSVARYREQACDAAVLGHAPTDRRTYATLLLRLADGRGSVPATLSLADSPTSLEDRIRAMQTLSQSSSPRITAALVTLLGLVLTAGIVGCSEMTSPSNAPSAASSDATTDTEPIDTSEVYVVVEDQPEMVGGREALYDAIEYPAAARKAGAEGRVTVQFIVDKDGNVVDPLILKSAGTSRGDDNMAEAPTTEHALLNEEALRVIKQMKFKPGKQRGTPVNVKMSVPINFQRPDSASAGAQTSSAEYHGGSGHTFALRVRADGTIHLGDEVVSVDRITQRLDARVREVLAGPADDTPTRLVIEPASEASPEMVGALQSALSDWSPSAAFSS
jgi:beta-lactamase regulating signal transducer with metallopeptidase domain